MPRRSPDQRRGLGDGGLWRLTAALLQAWDVATDPEKQASALWFSAVRDVTEGLLVELSSRGRAARASAQDRIREVEPPQPEQDDGHGHGLGRAIDGAVAKLEELTIRGDIAWTKRSGDVDGGAGVAESAAAYVDAMMADSVRILARCWELRQSGRDREDSLPSGELKTKMCVAVLRVLGRRTIAVEFRRSVEALQSGTFDIRLGSGAQATIRVKLDAIWPAPSRLQRSSCNLRENLGSELAYFLRFHRSGVDVLAGDKDTQELQSLYGCSSRRKRVTRDDTRNLLQECVAKAFHHECAQELLARRKFF